VHPLNAWDYATYIVELLDQFTYEEGENRALYRLLADTMAHLDLFSNPALVVRYYEVRLLDLLVSVRNCFSVWLSSQYST
jgi:recombinational DNA repair protein (RecF pathway)